MIILTLNNENFDEFFDYIIRNDFVVDKFKYQFSPCLKEYMKSRNILNFRIDLFNKILYGYTTDITFYQKEYYGLNFYDYNYFKKFIRSEKLKNIKYE